MKMHFPNGELAFHTNVFEKISLCLNNKLLLANWFFQLHYLHKIN